jgi:hypothetical protein
MKATHPVFFLLAANLMLAAPAAAPASSPKAPTQSERLQMRIDALLKRRLKPEPLPVVLPNPFVVVSGGTNGVRLDGNDDDGADGVVVETPAKPTEPVPTTSAEALARGAAKLRIGGMVRLKDELQIIINDSPRKVGDTVVLDRNNAMTYFQVVRIAPGEVTLRLNDATQTIRF